MQVDRYVTNGLRHVTTPEVRAMVEQDVNLLRMPDWPEVIRSLPNELVRSALFSVSNRHCRRNYIECEPIATIGDDITITYRGQELRQDDRDVWLELLHMARKRSITINEIGHPTVEFVPSQFCATIGWHKNSFYYNKLEDIMGRLSATEVNVTSKRLGRTIGFSLIRKKKIRGKGKDRLPKWQIWLEPELVEFMDQNYSTWIRARYNIGLSPLAKWLLAYYASHREPYPVLISTIMQGCGSRAKNQKNFRKNLRKALESLKVAGVLVGWDIYEQKVRVRRGNR